MYIVCAHINPATSKYDMLELNRQEVFISWYDVVEMKSNTHTAITTSRPGMIGDREEEFIVFGIFSFIQSNNNSLSNFFLIFVHN
jgi:hypothetical protein